MILNDSDIFLYNDIPLDCITIQRNQKNYNCFKYVMKGRLWSGIEVELVKKYTPGALIVGSPKHVKLFTEMMLKLYGEIV